LELELIIHYYFIFSKYCIHGVEGGGGEALDIEFWLEGMKGENDSETSV